MSVNTGYNGWTNYETWNVACWIQNDCGEHERWGEAAADQLRAEHTAEIDPETWKAEAFNSLASVMRDEYDEAVPELTGFYADLLSAALSDVNWYEIAGHYVDEAFDEVAEEFADDSSDE